MFTLRHGLGLRARFLAITGTGLLAIVVCVIALIGWFETSRVEDSLRAASESELLSLNALVSSAMEHRVGDKDEVAIAVFNRWFEHRNVDYPGKLWSVWSPRIAAFMADAAANPMPSFDGSAPPRTVAPKPPRDAIDEEALRTGKPVGRFIDGAYRYSLPIVLGVTAGTDQKVCRDCHVASIRQREGDVMSVFSSSLSTATEFAALRRLLLGVAGSALAGTLILLLTIRLIFDRVISRRLGTMTGVMRLLADGDRTITVPAQDRADEIGEMARAVEVFRRTAIEHLEAIEREEEHLRAELDKDATIMDMAEKIETETGIALEQISQHTAAMAATAGSMDASATRTGMAAQTAAEAAEQAVTNARTVAEAADQLSELIRRISTQVGQSATVVRRAVAAGDEARTTIEALNDKVARIGAVAGMIGDIAARTNLLALNATIEAARAGEAGRGFAVVAGEVKQLAAQTARSTEEIGRHIAEVRAATGASVEAVDAIGRTISEMDSIAGSIAAAVEEQGSATAHIARNVTQAAEAATAITERIGEVTEEALETGQHAADVQIDAAGLAELVSDLRRTVVRVIRASTTEVDRRRVHRHEVDIACRLVTSDHAAIEARLIDLSEGGARISGAGVLSAGVRGTLELRDLSVALPFIVREGGDGLTRLGFSLEGAAAEALRALLDRLPAAKAA